MSRSLRIPILALAVAQAVQAGFVAPRAPTPFARPEPDPINGWSPKPTQGPDLIFGSIENDRLFGRQQNTQLTNPQVCGWISGLSQSPISCANQGSTNIDCGYLVQSGSPYNVWCCPYTSASDGYEHANFNGCPWITSCLPYTDSANSNTGTAITRDTLAHVISCPSEIPECTTIFLQGPSTDTYFNYGCGTVATTHSAFQSYLVQAAAGTVSSSVTSTVSSNNAGLSSTTTTTTSSSSKSTTTSTSTSSGSSTNVGAIAGGVVGGVAAIAIIAGLIGWMVYRKKAARRPAMREVSQYTGGAYNPSMGGSTIYGGGAEGQSIAPSARK